MEIFKVIGCNCPPPARTLKKNQAPIYDTFGPFPDETLLSGIDRLLYFLGANRIQQFFRITTTCPDDSESSSDSCSNQENCSSSVASSAATVAAVMHCKSKSKKNVSHPVWHPPTPPRSCAQKSSSSVISICPTKSVNFTPTGSIKSLVAGLSKLSGSTKCQCAKCTGDKKNAPMKRSVSMSSVQCCKSKSKSKPKTTFQTKATVPPKWVWTRLYCGPKGFKTYEVYPGTSICTHPSRINDIINTPKFILLLLPSGEVVPFETVACKD